MANIYDINGNIINIGRVNGYIHHLNYSAPVHGINHRGYNTVAPENTLPAYRLSASHGFKFVECDVRFTSDSVPVLLHEQSINSMARYPDGTSLSDTVYIYDITYAQALEYDFTGGNSEYAGTKIARFDDFIKLCRALALHAYIDLKVGGSTTIPMLVNIVKDCDMLENVTWLCASLEHARLITGIDPYARIGMMNMASTDADFANIIAAQTGKNEVIANVAITGVTSAIIERCKNANIKLEVWSFSNSTAEILQMDTYISGYTANLYNAETVLYEANIND